MTAADPSLDYPRDSAPPGRREGSAPPWERAPRGAEPSSPPVGAPGGPPSSVAVNLAPSDTFVLTPGIQGIVDRALAYLRVGYPVHFSGPAGIGKTTLAYHVAALHGRPVILVHGDEQVDSTDMVGGEYGFRRSKSVDNFIRSVVKTEESMSTMWVDNQLTLACRHGSTLLYDEFTRSRPEANNALLSVLQEKRLPMPKRRVGDECFVEVHPEFRAIFTSNPEEYAGTHRAQDALMDRLITIRLDYFDRETEIGITQARSHISHTDASVIVDIVREMRTLGDGKKHGPSLRACIMIARVMVAEGSAVRGATGLFRDVCHDVLGTHAPMDAGETDLDRDRKIDQLLLKHAVGMAQRSGGATRAAAGQASW